MLAEERFAAILSILQKQRTVTVLELTQALSISESTIRRDLVALHKMGKLKRYMAVQRCCIRNTGYMKLRWLRAVRSMWKRKSELHAMPHR